MKATIALEATPDELADFFRLFGASLPEAVVPGWAHPKRKAGIL